MTLTPRLRRLALFSAQQELLARRAGKPPGEQPWNRELVEVLEHEVRTSGSGNGGNGTGCAGAELKPKNLISARQAGKILDCTARQVRNIDPAELGGVKVEGLGWVFEEDKVLEHREVQRNVRRARFA
jgi:hypothetical protein